MLRKVCLTLFIVLFSLPAFATCYTDTSTPAGYCGGGATSYHSSCYAGTTYNFFPWTRTICFCCTNGTSSWCPAYYPLTCTGEEPPPPPPPKRCPEEASGSVVIIDRQVLIENIPLVGIPFEFVYSSEKVAGREDWNIHRFNLTGSDYTVDANIDKEKIEVRVAGQVHTQDFTPTTNLYYDFEWDGNDNSSNPVAGTVAGEVEITAVMVNPSSYAGNSYTKPVFFGSIFPNSSSINGWRPSILHDYDAVREILYLGDGSTLDIKSIPISGGIFWLVPNSRNEVYEFNSSGKHVKTRFGLSGETKFEFFYDGSGKLIKVEDAHQNETTFQYSGSNLTSITSPFNQVTTIATSSGYISSATSPASQVYEMTYDSDGLLLTFEKPSGHTTTLTYDSVGRLTNNVQTSGKEITLTRAYENIGYSVTKTTAENRSSVYTYEGGKTKVELSSGVEKEKNEATGGAGGYENDGYSYLNTVTTDARFGNEVKRTYTETITEGSMAKSITYNETPVLSTPGDPFSLTTLTTATVVNGFTTTSVYTASTGTTVTTSPEGRVQTSITDGVQKLLSSQLGSLTPTTYSYDSLGRITASGAGVNRQTTYTYHTSNGLLATVTNPASQVTSYSYDLAGRIISETLPDSRVINYSYDVNGNQTGITPPGKVTHAMTYNAFDLLGSYLPPTIRTSESTATQYGYNDDEQLVQITRPDAQSVYFNFNSVTGNLDSMTTPGGGRSFTYENGREKTALSEDGVTKTLTYAGTLIGGSSMGDSNFIYYTQRAINLGHLPQTNYLISGTTYYTQSHVYDDDYLLIKVGDQDIIRSSTTPLITKLELDTIEQDFTYSSFGELASHHATEGSNDLYEVSYTRDHLGRIVTKTEAYGSSASNVYEYTYDSAGRLTEVELNSTPISQYTYDTNSNRIAQTVSGVSIAPSANMTGFNIGNVHSCAITVGGVKCWGYAAQGYIGYGNTTNIGDNETPSAVGYVSLSGTAKFLGLGDAHTCALLTNDDVRCWGLSTYGQLGLSNTTTIGDNEHPSSQSVINIGGDVKLLASGSFHNCVVKVDNEVVCWGAGANGRLGYGNTDNIGDTEHPNSAGEVPTGATDDIVQISAGISHTCILTSAGEVKCWGRNQYWQLGQGSSVTSIGDDETPDSASFLNLGLPAIQIAAGGDHTCAILNNNKLKCWGRNDSGQLGLSNTTTSTAALNTQGYVDVGADVKFVQVGKNSTCVITVNNEAKCWGANNVGQLGQGNTSTIGDNEHPSSISVINVGAPVVAIDPSGNHTCAVTNAGSMKCWGVATYGVLGYGNANNLGDDETPNSVGTLAGIDQGSLEYDAQDRLIRFGSKMFSYNKNGDMTSMFDSSTSGTTTYSYDVLGNLKQVVTPTKTVNYTVNTDNQRFSKKNGSTVEEYYLWNTDGQLVGVADDAGQVEKIFVYGSKDHVPDYMITSSADYQIITDHLGSPVVVANAADGTVEQEVKYDEFGRVLSDTSPGFTPFGFAGCLYDQDTKLCRFGARDYDASIGRWMSKDPIRFAGGDTNLYGYVLQDPVNLIDPEGLSHSMPFGGGGIPGGGAPAGAMPGGGGAAAAAAGTAAVAGALSCKKDGANPRFCEALLAGDLATCSALKSKAAYAICSSSAMTRYGECLHHGYPRSPLATRF